MFLFFILNRIQEYDMLKVKIIKKEGRKSMEISNEIAMKKAIEESKIN